ncbi:MAG TPA: cupin domain-containing protein [Solirubrobacterales bacterium]
MIARSESVDPMALELEPWPLEPDQVVAGDPRVSGRVLDTSADGKVERGVWQHTAGVSRDTESDEFFVVLTGRATIEVEDGPTLEVGPGDVGLLHAGDRTTWTVHEDLRKIYQTTDG